MATSTSSSSGANESLSLLRTQDTTWVNSTGAPVTLKGTNLGNWLMQELWMMGQDANGIEDQCSLEAKLTERFGYSEKERLMKLLRDSWITTRDWDQLQTFGFNLVRIPFMWNVIENEKSPKTLRADAWTYFDKAIAEAKKRGIYIIFDLTGAQGSQSIWTSSGCANQNLYWSSAENQDRVKWLWQQIASRYKDEPTIAAYDLLNEPWGSTSDDMVNRITELYNAVRLIDTKHILLLPSYFDSIDIYGDPAAKGMTNVALELHPYPGLFAESSNDTHYNIHRDWLRCGATGIAGVCAVNAKITALKTPLLMGEFQPWQNAGTELGGKIARATYDTYANYRWAATSWAYKVVSTDGGQGQGSWGIVTNTLNSNDSGMGLAVNASTWACAGWNSTFTNGCAKAARRIKVDGSGSKTYYLAIKTGANVGSNLDVTYDNISIVKDSTTTDVITNGGFGSNTGWTSLNISNAETVDFNYNTGDKTPIGGSGSVLRVSRPMGATGEING
ncbi:MAG: endoglucanase, partial [Moraxellaceae bacterium]